MINNMDTEFVFADELCVCDECIIDEFENMQITDEDSSTAEECTLEFNQITEDIVEFSQSIDPTQKNLIFDIDGTIFDSCYNYVSICYEFREGLRPNFDKLLEYCVLNNYKIYLWTAANIEHTFNILKSIENHKCITKVLCRGLSWFNISKVEKKLSLLSDDTRNILLIDNTHYISIGQEDNVIVVPTYEISHKMSDSTMLDLLSICQQIPKNVYLIDYVKQNLLNVVTDGYDNSLSNIVKIKHRIL